MTGTTSATTTMTTTMPSLSEGVQQAAKLLPTRFPNWQPPQFFLQFGSGFDLETLFDAPASSLPMQELPGMPCQPTPDREHPVLQYGAICGIPVLAARGHRHLYEGLGLYPCLLPLCTARKLGAQRHLFIGSGLSLRQEIKAGTWTLLVDYINGHSLSPLDGNHDLLESSFPDMTGTFSQEQNSELVNAMSEVGLSPRHSVFMARPGSQFCSVAEAEVARSNGADLIGHDLVMEIIMAHALGCKVSALVLAAAMAPDYRGKPLRRQDLLDNCRFCSRDINRGLRKAMPELIADAAPPIRLPDAEADDILHQDFKRPTGRTTPNPLALKKPCPSPEPNET